MIDINRSEKPFRYNVQVGHSRVQVDGYCTADAIQEARLRLSADLPRLYDVIHAMDESSFDVMKLNPSSAGSTED